MFDIVKQIDNYLNALKVDLSELSQKDRCFFSVWCMRIVLKLPNAITIINNTYKLNLTDEGLLEHILSAKNIGHYELLIKKSLDEMEEYADDFVEMEQLDIFVLAGFEQCIKGVNNSDDLVYAAENLINILDFYEQFTDEQEYWNNLLEQEFIGQKEFVDDILKGKPVNIDSYHEFYENVNFESLS